MGTPYGKIPRKIVIRSDDEILMQQKRNELMNKIAATEAKRKAAMMGEPSGMEYEKLKLKTASEMYGFISSNFTEEESEPDPNKYGSFTFETLRGSVNNYVNGNAVTNVDGYTAFRHAPVEKKSKRDTASERHFRSVDPCSNGNDENREFLKQLKNIK